MVKRSDRFSRMCLALLITIVLYPTIASAHGSHSHAPAAKSDGAADHHHGEATLADVRAEVGKLRRQLDGYEQTIRMRDVIGGLGYLVGIGGVAFYFLGKKRTEPAE